MKLVPAKTNREIISWLGGGAVVIVGGAWTLFTYLHDDKKPAAPMATVGTSSGSIIAPGGTFNGPVSVFDEKKNSEQLNAALAPVQETLAALVARDKGVEAAPLRIILINKLGEKGFRDEDIPTLLDKKADELIALRKKFAELQSGPPDLASSAQQAQALLDRGDFRGALKEVLHAMSIANADFAEATSIATSMQSDNQKQQIERWRILQETQEQLFSIQKDVTANKAQTQDEKYNTWDKNIRN